LPTSFIVLREGKIASVARILTSKRPPSALSSEKTRSLRQTASGAIQGDQRQVQHFRLLDLTRRQGTITPDQAQADGGMDIGDWEPGGVVVGRVDERRGEGAEERRQNSHGGVLCRCADVVTGREGALDRSAIPMAGADDRGADIVEQVWPMEVTR